MLNVFERPFNEVYSNIQWIIIECCKSVKYWLKVGRGKHIVCEGVNAGFSQAYDLADKERKKMY